MATTSDAVAAIVADATGTQATELVRLSGGASRETWRAVAGARELIVQCQRVGDERDMMTEARVVAAAAAAGVPVPELIAAGHMADGDGYMVVESVEGETIARKIQRDDQFSVARERFASECGRALARIHQMDPDIDGLEATDQIEWYTSILDEVGSAQPILELARRWLLIHRPAPSRTTVVHGDFRLGNLIIDSDGLQAVIDWELAHLGDPMEDLGWLCVGAWRFGGSEPVGGIGTRDDLYAAYEQASGHAVEPEMVRWWEVLGTWKWAVMCLLQSHAHLSGAVRSHELAAIGRRVSENEFALLDPAGLNLAGLPEVAPPVADAGRRVEQGAPAAPGVYGEPTASHLVEAVREWIETDVASATQGRTKFHARVASNVLAIVERELAVGSVHEAQHRARLDRVGVASDAELAAAIRQGDFDDKMTELGAELLGAAVDRLAVSNPRELAQAKRVADSSTG